jgi:hypothetical protein
MIGFSFLIRTGKEGLLIKEECIMAHTFKELKHMNVAQLREIADSLEGHPIQGFTQMNKDHLLNAICETLNIDMFVHHHVEGIDKTRIKQEIRKFKKQRDELLLAKNRKELPMVRKNIKRLKKELRRHMV